MKLDIDILDALRRWMLANGVRHARCGDVEVTLGDVEPPDMTTLASTYQASLPGLPPPMPAERPSDPLDDPVLFGGEVPNFRVPEDK